MARKERRSVGFSTTDYDIITQLAEERKVPMTKMIMFLLEATKEMDFNWSMLRDEVKSERISYSERVARIEELREKFGNDLDDEKLVQFTGYSLSTVESLTHTAQKRVLAVLRRKKDIDIATLAERATVSPRMAERVYEQFHGRKKIPEREQYLFATGKRRVTG